MHFLCTLIRASHPCYILGGILQQGPTDEAMRQLVDLGEQNFGMAATVSEQVAICNGHTNVTGQHISGTYACLTARGSLFVLPGTDGRKRKAVGSHVARANQAAFYQLANLELLRRRSSPGITEKEREALTGIEEDEIQYLSPEDEARVKVLTQEYTRYFLALLHQLEKEEGEKEAAKKESSTPLGKPATEASRAQRKQGLRVAYSLVQAAKTKRARRTAEEERRRLDELTVGKAAAKRHRFEEEEKAKEASYQRIKADCDRTERKRADIAAQHQAWSTRKEEGKS